MNFSPYRPPPDEALLNPDNGSSKGKGSDPGKKSKRPWFSRDASSYVGGYQSGGSNAVIFDSSADSAGAPSYLTNDPEAGSSTGGPVTSTNAWETRFGTRVDVEAASAYIGGPVTALLLLILETTNDYVRFHAYQSALLTTPLLLIWLFMTLLNFWRWLRTTFFVLSLLYTLYAAFRAFRDPSLASPNNLPGNTLPRYYIPVIGDYADRWVGDE